MFRVVSNHSAESVDTTSPPSITLLDDTTLKATGAQEHLLAVDAAGCIGARCSLWHTNTPILAGEATGFIGHYAANGAEAGGAVLAAAIQKLGNTDAKIAVGPIDGNTWRSYRLVTDRGQRPAFFMEPDHPADWPDHFIRSGFSPLAEYFSTETHHLTARQPKYAQLQQRLERAGVTIRALNPDRFDEELRRVYDLSIESFANNFLYSPIDRESFLAMYESIRKKLAPELVLLAERGETLLGYVFGVPDLLQADRGGSIDTVIIKTLAVRPGRDTAGLGGLLMEHCQLAAHRIGLKRAIHALMHESNKSRSLSSYYGQPFRRYTLFSRRIRA